MLFDDTYQSIAEPAEGFFKDKGSKFLAYAYPIENDAQAKSCLTDLHELHPKAVHHCYAYRLGADRMSYRMSDDGEPSGTAGRPILNTLYSRNITNVLVVVVRYFGGTLLGVPGLINAYRTATEAALDVAEIITRHYFGVYRLSFQYAQMNDVMRIVKEMELPVRGQTLEMQCVIEVEVRSSLVERFITRSEKVDGLAVEFVY